MYQQPARQRGPLGPLRLNFCTARHWHGSDRTQNTRLDDGSLRGGSTRRGSHLLRRDKGAVDDTPGRQDHHRQPRGSGGRRGAAHGDTSTHYQTADGRIHQLPPGCGPVCALRGRPRRPLGHGRGHPRGSRSWMVARASLSGARARPHIWLSGPLLGRPRDAECAPSSSAFRLELPGPPPRQTRAPAVSPSQAAASRAPAASRPTDAPLPLPPSRRHFRRGCGISADAALLPLRLLLPSLSPYRTVLLQPRPESGASRSEPRRTPHWHAT